MLPFGVTIPATVPQRSEIPEGLRITLYYHKSYTQIFNFTCIIYRTFYLVTTY